MILPPADPGIAAVTFDSHLETYWTNSGRDAKGWSRTQIDALHTVVTIPAPRPDGGVDPYYVRLGADYYDAYPPTVLIVAPEEGWPRARAGTPWWPVVTPPNWCALHDTYPYSDAQGRPLFEGQLVCFSMTAEYYMSNHGPTEAQRWTPGRHTVAATLSRLGEILSPLHYGGQNATRPA
ncbi:MAG: hypothetical protein M3011_04190 [Actinomycetota bacterium]|nr:hypothetical protein [Actinomycetota bacterium]